MNLFARSIIERDFVMPYRTIEVSTGALKILWSRGNSKYHKDPVGA
jgi:hypothetical protein